MRIIRLPAGARAPRKKGRKDFMKRTARKWLSLLMAFAIVLSLMPAALAVDHSKDHKTHWEHNETQHWEVCETQDCTYSSAKTDHNYGEWTVETPATCSKEGSRTRTYETCGDKLSEPINKTEHTYNENEGTVTKEPTCTEKGTKEFVCTVCKEKVTVNIAVDSNNHDWGEWEASKTDSTMHTRSCKRQGCTVIESAKHTYGEDGKCTICQALKPTDENKLTAVLSKSNYDTSSTVYIDRNSITLRTGLTVKKGTTTLKASEYTVEYKWEGDVPDNSFTGEKGYDCVIYNPDTRITNKKVKCTVTVTTADGQKATDSVTWSGITNVGSSTKNVSVTIYSDTTYYLGEKDDKGTKSVLDQIDDYINDQDGGYLDEICFTKVTHSVGDLDAAADKWYSSGKAEDISFEPETTGTAEFGYEATSTGSKKEYSGTISIKVEKGSASSGDIEYTASSGKTVTFDAKDFDDFWTDEFSSGILDYVTFSTSSSNGTLYDGKDNKLSSSSKCYYDPSSRQVDLDQVYFEPKSSKAGTVKISFTAYGLNKKNGTDKELDGTVVITYLNGDIDDITYTTDSKGKVELVASDFTSVFKKATGSSSSSLTITFNTLPTNGTLTYGSRDTKVTKSTSFKTSGSGNKISDVTYTASGSKSDTIEYTAASGSTKIKGKIVFNAAPVVNISLQVPYTCTSANGVTFSSADFTSRAPALTSSHTIAFGQPNNGNGGLYYTGIGTKIDAGIRIPVSTLNTVTYRPSTNGSASITCIVYDAAGTIVGSGTVTITVNIAGANTNPGGSTNPGTAVSVNNFRDVEATAWYRSDLERLVNLGVVAGTSPTKFDPLGELTYGAALKLICKAVDVTQPETTGAQWAVNYKNYAAQQGWITGNEDLTATIKRTQVAQIVAKALNLSPSSAKPFPDSDDPYVAAVNAAGIIRGNAKGTFEGNSTLRRNEVCAIVCRMLDYRANSYGNEKPGWL